MSTLHFWLAELVAAAVVATLAAVVVGFSGRPLRRLVDRLLLVEVAAVLVAALAGAVLLLSGKRPADPLHFVYAIAALLALPVARYVGRSGTTRRRAAIMTAGCLVAGGIVARLFMTGR